MSSRPPSPIPDEGASVELVRRIQNGESDAWDELYRRYRDRLLLYIRCRIGPSLRSRLQSEDILQSVFKDAVDDLQGFTPQGEESVKHFLRSCVLNKIRKKVTYFSAKKRSGDLPLTDTMLGKISDSEPIDKAGYHDATLYDQLERSINLLPEAMREVLFLRLFESHSNQECATALGKTPEASSKLFNRALARLGILMSEAGGS